VNVVIGSRGGGEYIVEKGNWGVGWKNIRLGSPSWWCGRSTGTFGSASASIGAIIPVASTRCGTQLVSVIANCWVFI